MHLDLLIGVQAELTTFARRFDAEVKSSTEKIKPGRPMPRTEFCDVLDSLIALLQEAGRVAEQNTLRLSAIAASPDSAPEAIAILVRLAVARQSIADYVRAVAEGVLNSKEAEPESYQHALNGRGLRLPYRYHAEEPDHVGCKDCGTVDLGEDTK